jgi:hypothetical protein
MEVPHKTETITVKRSSNTFLGIYLKGYKSAWNREPCTPMFITALCTEMKIWDQPRGLLKDE